MDDKHEDDSDSSWYMVKIIITVSINIIIFAIIIPRSTLNKILVLITVISFISIIIVIIVPSNLFMVTVAPVAVIGLIFLYYYMKSSNRDGPVQGLPNSYLNCYFNSTLQCLFATPEFVSLQKNNKRPLAEMFRRLEENHDIETLKSIGGRVMPEFGTMQCAHVAFLNLVNALAAEEDQVLLDRYRKMFEVKVEYELKCENGDPINTSENHYFSLSLPTPPIGSRNLNVFDSLKVLTLPKKIEYPCDTCGGNSSTHTAKIAGLSSILVIHFQRYIDGGKDDRIIDFPEVIDISERRYEVYGVVYHNGTLNGGHYYAYVKYSGVWYEANDMKVEKIGVKKPPCEGAYMIFCNQIDKS